MILLTGASGFIGSHVLQKLQKSGEEICILGRQKLENLPDGVTQITVDLQDFAKTSEAVGKIRANHLIHLAWYAEHGRYWESEKNLSWVMASLNLVQSFVEAGGEKVVVAGTCAEYDWQHGYCREEITPTNPKTLYGVSKLSTFCLLSRYCQNSGVSLAWGRIFIPYGPGENPSRLIPSLIRSLKEGKPAFPINLLAYRDFLRVEDVATGLISLFNPLANGVFNIASGTAIRLLEILRIIGTLTDNEIESFRLVAKKNVDEPLILVGDNQKLKNLGWEPSFEIGSGLEDLLDLMEG